MLDALKYGPLGLAGIVALLSYYLLNSQLARPGGISSQPHKAIRGFMTFSLILVAGAVAVTAIDKLVASTNDRTLADIRQEVGSLNMGILAKMSFNAQSGIFSNPQDASMVMNFTKAICEHTNRIAILSASAQPPMKCPSSTP